MSSAANDYSWALSGMGSASDSGAEPGSDGSQRPLTVGDPPSTIGRFSIRKELGRGGMGAVFLAHESELGRDVAIKVLHAVNSDRALRLRREGNLAGSLTHPGIVKVLGSGELDGLPYLVYELVEGARPISDAFPGATLGRRVEWIRDAALALAHAHEMGVLHRDVKPDNLLIDRTGVLRVADFGLAVGRGMDRITQSGAMLGTPSHMAPEQIKADREALSPATDVWGLGVVFYQALTGQLPFSSSSFMELAVKITEGHYPPPTTLNAEIPLPLEAVCVRALAAAPEDRYPDCGAFAEDLDAWLNRRPVSGSSVSPPKPPAPRWAMAVAGLALIVLAISLLLALFPSDPNSRPPPATDRPTAETPTTAEPAEPPPPTTEAELLPAWYRALPAKSRPSLPLPKGLTFGAVPGEYVNAKDGSQLVWVPPGRFRMGSTRRAEERPIHEVELTQGFFMGKYELTIGQYRRFCRETGRDYVFKPPYETTDEHPVAFVSWVDARAYCKWAGLRLPTEAQWEFAARGSDGRIYPWGSRSDPKLANTKEGRRGPGTNPVGSHPEGASPFVCLDMAGNVFEWVLDGGAKYRESPQVDPFLDPEPAPARVIRGGCFGNDLRFATTTFRDFGAAETWNPIIGFRVSRSSF